MRASVFNFQAKCITSFITSTFKLKREPGVRSELIGFISVICSDENDIIWSGHFNRWFYFIERFVKLAIIFNAFVEAAVSHTIVSDDVGVYDKIQDV